MEGVYHIELFYSGLMYFMFLLVPKHVISSILFYEWNVSMVIVAPPPMCVRTRMWRL